MKGQPLAYNRDNQEDKPPLFDAHDTWSASLRLFAAMLPNVEVQRAACRAAAFKGYSTATDLADYLVKRGLPMAAESVIVQGAYFTLLAMVNAYGAATAAACRPAWPARARRSRPAARPTRTGPLHRARAGHR